MHSQLFKPREYHINGYRLQYWLYALLNHKFGTEVRFERSRLHTRYAVNRHDFSVATNTQSVKVVKKGLLEELQKAGYEIDSENETTTLKKTTVRATGVEKLYITLEETKEGYYTRSPSLRVGLNAYWHENMR